MTNKSFNIPPNLRYLSQASLPPPPTTPLHMKQPSLRHCSMLFPSHSFHPPVRIQLSWKPSISVWRQATIPSDDGCYYSTEKPIFALGQPIKRNRTRQSSRTASLISILRPNRFVYSLSLCEQSSTSNYSPTFSTVSRKIQYNYRHQLSICY